MAMVLLGATLIAWAIFIPRLPRAVVGTGTLDQCSGQWPVVRLEGEQWKGSLPEDIRAHAPLYIPIAEWPSGFRFDEASGQLRDADGETLFHKGDRVRISGTIIEVNGDPSPCYYTLGIRVDEIAVP